MSDYERIHADVLRTLRLECSEIDDNDWPDDLHPSDVISKHLVRGWQEKVRDVERERDQLRKVIARIWPASFRCRCGAQVVGGLSTREMADWLTEHWPHVGLHA